MAPLDVCVIIVFCIAILYYRLAAGKGADQIPLPPGPPPWPIIGNALDLAPVEPPGPFRRWKEQFGMLFFLARVIFPPQRLTRLPGNMVHLTALGQHIVVLNSAKVIVELLEKRGRIYSSRPNSVMAKL